MTSAIVDLEVTRASVDSNEGHSVSGKHALSAKADGSDLELELEPSGWRRDPSTGSCQWRPAEKPADGSTPLKRDLGAPIGAWTLCSCSDGKHSFFHLED